jgi:hypothetical protein
MEVAPPEVCGMFGSRRLLVRSGGERNILGEEPA